MPTSAEVVFAVYKPIAGKEKELEKLIRNHVSNLREFGLVTKREPVVVKSQDGSYIEIFEWASKEAVEKAHHHPGVAKIWEAFSKVCQFGKLSQLKEAQEDFCHFMPVNINH